MKKLVVLTGAGISAESGINTFRDSGGLWEGHNVMDVASPEGWRRDPELVLDFYNKRRRQLQTVKPNAAHTILAQLEQDFDVQIITQNVDDLHERAGSSKVLHLHGELLKVRSIRNPNYILDWTADLSAGDTDDLGHQLRPHIVWFGEEVPALEEAVHLTSQADYFAVVGTSLQVYPAAGLIDFTRSEIPLYYVDPKPAHIPNLRNRVAVIPEVASKGMEILREMLLKSDSQI
jgi:NAD-dependent deacetylase